MSDLFESTTKNAQTLQTKAVRETVPKGIHFFSLNSF
jgi:hypothetical protein